MNNIHLIIVAHECHLCHLCHWYLKTVTLLPSVSTCPENGFSDVPLYCIVIPQFKALNGCFWVVTLRPHANAITARMAGKWLFQVVWWRVSFVGHQHSLGREFLKSRKGIQILGGQKWTDTDYIHFVIASNFFLFYELY